MQVALDAHHDAGRARLLDRSSDPRKHLGLRAGVHKRGGWYAESNRRRPQFQHAANIRLVPVQPDGDPPGMRSHCAHRVLKIDARISRLDTADPQHAIARQPAVEPRHLSHDHRQALQIVQRRDVDRHAHHRARAASIERPHVRLGFNQLAFVHRRVPVTLIVPHQRKPRHGVERRDELRRQSAALRIPQRDIAHRKTCGGWLARWLHSRLCRAHLRHHRAERPREILQAHGVMR